MSIGVGTLQPKTRIFRPVWLAGLLAVIVALAAAVIVTNSSDEPARETSGTQTAVTGTAENTPSELRGGVKTAPSTTLANTPSELRPHVPRRVANPESISGSVGNTPSELSGGLPSQTRTGEGLAAMERFQTALERYARHQLR
ncbi:MAG TPA: hypothetical protein VJ774_04305 [Actinomycetota bacterium]|nr:hypothetical protein [Actinomycetota bacterium]